MGTTLMLVGHRLTIACLGIVVLRRGEHHEGARPGKASLANVNHSLRRLRHELERADIKSIALPRLATGVGGLDWSEVLPLIVDLAGSTHHEPIGPGGSTPKPRLISSEISTGECSASAPTRRSRITPPTGSCVSASTSSMVRAQRGPGTGS
jgi:hypothetical protein